MPLPLTTNHPATLVTDIQGYVLGILIIEGVAVPKPKIVLRAIVGGAMGLL